MKQRTSKESFSVLCSSQVRSGDMLIPTARCSVTRRTGERQHCSLLRQADSIVKGIQDTPDTVSYDSDEDQSGLLLGHEHQDALGAGQFVDVDEISASDRSSLSTTDDSADSEGNENGAFSSGKDNAARIFFRISPPIKPTLLLKEVDDVDQYMSSRDMTPTQELVNALTMIPSPLYCLYFLLSGVWVSQAMVEEARHDLLSNAMNPPEPTFGSGGLFVANSMLGDKFGCLPSASSWWHMPALPPLPVLAVAFSIIVHAPFSILYHLYARRLPPGVARTAHWSRRMDHSMIHFASAFISYGTSGSWDFFVANLVYNADCIYRQFKRRIRPRRNKVRVFMSVVSYTVPILYRGDVELFMELWSVLGLSFWLFGTYPIGGWSHSAFHIAMAFFPPLMMTAACTLPTSQEQMRLAAQCVALQQID